MDKFQAQIEQESLSRTFRNYAMGVGAVIVSLGVMLAIVDFLF